MNASFFPWLWGVQIGFQVDYKCADVIIFFFFVCVAAPFSLIWQEELQYGRHCPQKCCRHLSRCPLMWRSSSGQRGLLKKSSSHPTKLNYSINRRSGIDRVVFFSFIRRVTKLTKGLFFACIFYIGHKNWCQCVLLYVWIWILFLSYNFFVIFFHCNISTPHDSVSIWFIAPITP